MNPAEPTAPDRVTAYVALGANLGNPREMLVQALDHLEACFAVQIHRRSSWYRTAAVGGRPNQPDYLNAVAAIGTPLSARDLLTALLDTERHFGRQRTTPNAPRLLDLDLLLYADQVIDEPGLVIPHPRMHIRRFVLQPLCDLIPNAIHPVLEVSMSTLLQDLP